MSFTTSKHTLPTSSDLHLLANQTTTCTGTTLAQLLAKKKNPFKGDDVFVRRAFTQLVDAVQRLHERGIFHRDITPANIVVSEDKQRVFLTGFGLATTEEMSREFEYGVRAFMSPECIATPCNRRTSPSFSNRTNDIWALGVIFTLLLTGKLPWAYAYSIVDMAYGEFTVDPASLLRKHKISQESLNVLVRIFNPDAMTRISLVELSGELAKVGTFFPASSWTLGRKSGRQASISSSSSASDSSSTLSRASGSNIKKEDKADKKAVKALMRGIDIEVAKQMGVIRPDATPDVKERKWFGLLRRKEVLVY